MKIELKNKSYYEVACQSDVDKLFKGKGQIIQGIKNVIPLIIELCDTDYLNKYFNTTRSIESQFYNLLPVNKPFYQGIHSSLNSSVCKINNSYRLKLIWGPDIKCFESHSVPLYFLPHLEKSNKEMFDLVFQTIALLCKTCSISFIEGFYLEDNLEHYKEILEIEEDVSGHLREDIELYERHSMDYINLVRTKNYSLNSIENKLSKYITEFKIEKVIIEWIWMMIDVIKMKDNLEHYDDNGIERLIDDAIENGILDPEEDPYNLFDDGHPLLVSYTFSFTWFNEGYEKQNAFDYINEIAGNFGYAEYYEEFICTSTDQVKEAKKFAEENKDHFLKKLEEAMDFGYQHIEEIYDYSKGNIKLIHEL